MLCYLCGVTMVKVRREPSWRCPKCKAVVKQLPLAAVKPK